MSRLKYSIKNAQITLLFYLLLAVLNYFSRRVFIDVLGNEVVGMTATMQNYVGMLNLADMGISAAIATFLYAPLYAADHNKIKEIISLYGYLFRLVGIVIAVAGVILSLFLGVLIADDGVQMWMVYAAFYTFLFTTLMSYMVNYKQNLLVAHQKNYVVVTILNTTIILKTIAQIVLLKWVGCGLVTWLAMEVITAVVFAVWLEFRIKREYPWLSTQISQGRQIWREYPEIGKNIKRVFSHKVAGFVMQQSDPIVVQLIMGFSMVTYYTNYTIIVNQLIRLIVGSLSSNFAGVGNLIAEGNAQKVKRIFWQMNAMYFWVGGVVAFGFYMFVSPLMRLWLPKTMIFDNYVVMLLAINLYIYIIRQPLGYYVQGYALFGDTAAAWIEALLNLVISVVICLKFGVIGIVAGTAVSTFIVVILWRPHYLYTRGFGQRSGLEFWTNLGKYLLLLAMIWGGVEWFYSEFYTVPDNWSELIVACLIFVPVMGFVYGLLLWFTSLGMRDFVQLGVNLLRRRN